MTFERLKHIVCLHLLPSYRLRGKYIRKYKVFACFGEKSLLQTNVIPLYPNLIRIHKNVKIGKRVEFVTHDAIHMVINNIQKDFRAQERIGCIEVHDNVFIGANSIILYGVSIGANSIVAAGSVVTKDVPPNSVVAGVPARVIGSFDQVVEKIKNSTPYPLELKPRKQKASEELCRYMWERFDAEHNQVSD